MTLPAPGTLEYALAQLATFSSQWTALEHQQLAAQKDIAVLKNNVAALSGSNPPPVAVPPPVVTPPDPPPAQSGIGAADLSDTIITPAPNPVTLDPDLYVLPRGNSRIYHYGLLNPAPPSNTDQTLSKNLGPYTVLGLDGSIIDVPAHWWLSRWRDGPEWTIVNSPTDLVDQHFMFAYGDIGVPVPSPPARVPYTIMGSSDCYRYEPTTGERPDIGLITDNSAYFMLWGDPAAMLDWAGVSMACPNHYRDQATDQPIDLTKYPTANAYDVPNAQGGPWLNKGPASPSSNGYSVSGGGWTVQKAHHSERCYVAFMATDDPTLLEEVQFNANFALIGDATLSAQLGKATVCGEQRGIAWGLRDLFMASAATKYAESKGVKTGPGTPFQPSSYWQQLLDNAREYYDQFRTDPNNQVWRLFAVGFRFGPWQQDYCLAALAFGILTGHKEWTDNYVFALGNAISRTDGVSGYPPGWGGAYYLNTYEWAKNPDGTYNQGAYDTTKPLDWYGAFLFQQNDPNGPQLTDAQIAALKADSLNGGVAMQGVEYIMGTRAVLAMACYIDSEGIAPIRATYPQLDTAYQNAHKFVLGMGGVNPRQSVLAKRAS